MITEWSYWRCFWLEPAKLLGFLEIRNLEFSEMALSFRITALEPSVLALALGSDMMRLFNLSKSNLSCHHFDFSTKPTCIKKTIPRLK